MMTNASFHFLPELLSILTLAISFIAILCTIKFFGKYGLYTYSAIVTITSNIQVLKLTQYSLIPNPVALGTVLFSTTFAVDNILTEYYGAKSAKQGLYVSFSGYMFFVIVMQIAVWHPVVIDTECINMYSELEKIFSPVFFLFISSLIAYFVGQHTDIFIYSMLKKFFRGKFLSLRSMISMVISAFVDNFVFSLFAWIVFAENPISLSLLWKTYIFITYMIRLVIAALCVPLVKLAGKFIPEKNDV